jgi:hypothetical protein
MKTAHQVAGTPRVSASPSHALNQGITTEIEQLDPVTIALLIALGVKVGIIDLVSP